MVSAGIVGLCRRGRSGFCTRLHVTPLTRWMVRERAKPLGRMHVNHWRATGREPSALVLPRLH